MIRRASPLVTARQRGRRAIPTEAWGQTVGQPDGKRPGRLKFPGVARRLLPINRYFRTP